MRRSHFLAWVLVLLAQPVRADLLVLVHGYMADAGTWEVHGVMPVLAANGWQPAGLLNTLPATPVPDPGPVPARRVYSVNLPAAAPLQVQAAELAGLLHLVRERYPDERLIIAGHSAGGVVGRMLLIGGNPFRVDTLVTIASPNLGTSRAAQGLDVVDFNPFFCPGPGLEFVKSFFGGARYDYLEHSRGALIDLLPAESGNVLAWLNQQPHPDIHYYAIVRGSPFGPGDDVVPAYSQDMNNVAALRGRVRTLFTPAAHGLNPQDGQLLANLLAGSSTSTASAQ